MVNTETPTDLTGFNVGIEIDSYYIKITRGERSSPEKECTSTVVKQMYQVCFNDNSYIPVNSFIYRTYLRSAHPRARVPP